MLLSVISTGPKRESPGTDQPPWAREDKEMFFVAMQRGPNLAF
jgi:hypothetical protein